jgi:GT2 family glycosyltransferase/SAM-dependent methyltransferase
MSHRSQCLVCGSKQHENTIWGGYDFRKVQYRIVRCSKCGFMFVNPAPDWNVLSEIYTGADYFEGYHATATGIKSYIEAMGQYNPLDENVIALIRKFKSRGRLLDVGCAGGRFLYNARKHGFEVSGIELNKAMVDYAARVLDLNVSHGTLETFAAKGKAYDIVHAADVLEHLSDLRKNITIIKEMLSDNGILVIQQPLMYNKSFFNLLLRINMFFKRNKYSTNPPLHLWEFNADTLKDFLERMGFEVIYYNISESKAKPLAPHKPVSLKMRIGYWIKNVSETISNSLILDRLELGDRAIVICKKADKIGLKLSVVMPVYNEVRYIKEIIEKVKSVDIDKEIIIVDDFSTDGTRDILKGIKEDGVKVFFHEKNMGKGAAVRMGFRHAQGDVVVIQDADLEYDPHDYPKLLRPIVRREADAVYGSRFLKRGYFFYIKRPFYLTHFLGNKALNFLTIMLYGNYLTDMETCYKAIRRQALLKLDLKGERFEIEPEITAKLFRKGFKIKEVPISYIPRDYMEGKKISWKDGYIAFVTLLKYRFRKI